MSRAKARKSRGFSGDRVVAEGVFAYSRVFIKFFNILDTEKTLIGADFELDFSGKESVTVW